MLIFDTVASTPTVFQTTVTLTLDERNRTRQRVRLDDGREAGISLERQAKIEPGSLLVASSGESIKVVPASEPVSVASTGDVMLLKRACYHLGNRHVQLQISDDWVAYQPDHVLDQMLSLLGLEVENRNQPFEPESGAYSHGHHHHEHKHAKSEKAEELH